MTPLRALADLAWRDRLLLAHAFVMLALVRVALSLVPWPAVRHLLVGRSILRSPLAGAASAEHIVWAVERAGRFVPRATCLVQAVAARIMLARVGHAAELRIGVAKSTTGHFEAHAWLEHNGEVLMGRVRQLERFAPLHR